MFFLMRRRPPISHRTDTPFPYSTLCRAVPLSVARPGARLVALIKPQFEAARHEVGKKGVVRDATVHVRVCDAVRDWLESEGWRVVDLVESPITGPEGNVEFLVAAVRED